MPADGTGASCHKDAQAETNNRQTKTKCPPSQQQFCAKRPRARSHLGSDGVEGVERGGAPQVLIGGQPRDARRQVSVEDETSGFVDDVTAHNTTQHNTAHHTTPHRSTAQQHTAEMQHTAAAVTTGSQDALKQHCS